MEARSVAALAPEYASNPPAPASATPAGDRRVKPQTAIELPAITDPQRFAPENFLIDLSSSRPILRVSAIKFPFQWDSLFGCDGFFAGARHSGWRLDFSGAPGSVPLLSCLPFEEFLCADRLAA